MTTAYHQPTAWNQRPAPAETASASRPLSAEAREQVIPESDDPWDSVKLLAEKAAATVGIERDITDAFERRRTLAKRLADAYRRRDDSMAAEAARAWITSEVKIAAIFDKYEGHVQERNELLKAYVNEAAPG